MVDPGLHDRTVKAVALGPVQTGSDHAQFQPNRPIQRSWRGGFVDGCTVSWW